MLIKCRSVACNEGVFFGRAICSRKRHAETFRREGEMRRFLLSPIFHCHKIKDGTNKVSPTQNTTALQVSRTVEEFCFCLRVIKQIYSLFTNIYILYLQIYSLFITAKKSIFDGQIRNEAMSQALKRDRLSYTQLPYRVRRSLQITKFDPCSQQQLP